MRLMIFKAMKLGYSTVEATTGRSPKQYDQLEYQIVAVAVAIYRMKARGSGFDSGSQ
jgi:hypothetical protein